MGLNQRVPAPFNAGDYYVAENRITGGFSVFIREYVLETFETAAEAHEECERWKEAHASSIEVKHD